MLLHRFTAFLIAFGPWGMLPLSILDSAGVPVAGALDALLIFLAVEDPDRAYLCATLAVVGSTIGNMILFYVGRRGGRRLVERASKPGRTQRFRDWFLRYGMATIFVPALVPAPMPLKLFVLLAGAFGTGAVPFLGVTIVARFLRYFGEAWLGVTLGRESGGYLKTHAWQLAVFAVVLLAALYLGIWYAGRRRGLSLAPVLSKEAPTEDN